MVYGAWCDEITLTKRSSYVKISLTCQQNGHASGIYMSQFTSIKHAFVFMLGYWKLQTYFVVDHVNGKCRISYN